MLVPPKITKVTPNDTLLITKGGSVKLSCEASGYPRPTMTWRREDGPILQRDNGLTHEVQVVEGTELILSIMTQSDMGTYYCIARNEVPPDISKRIVISLQPETTSATGSRNYFGFVVLLDLVLGFRF